MHFLPATGSLDESGRLVHEDDLAAQLALSVARFEAALTAAGLGFTDLAELRVLTTDRPGLDEVYDVLTERLDEVGADPVIRIRDVPDIGVAGMVVALEGEIGTPQNSGLNEESPTPKERK